MTILCIDDDGEDLELLQEAILEIDASIVCVLVNSAQEALDLLGSGLLPDLITLDINMPGMDGVTCLTKIRVNEKFQEIKIVLLSTSIYPLNIEKIRTYGATYVTKPNNFEDLVTTFSSVLSKVKV